MALKPSKRAVVTGMIGTFPVGGVVWDYGQYLLGLQQLGYEVWYLEDNGTPTYDPVAKSLCAELSFTLGFLRDSLQYLSPEFANRWAFRDETGALHGMSDDALNQLVAGADLFLNVSGGTLLRDAYMANPCKVIIDTDPGVNHFVNYPHWDAGPGWQGTHGFRGHDHFFTYAELLGAPDCMLPDLGLCWQPTRPPVMLDLWKPEEDVSAYTTVMAWNQYRDTPIKYGGRTYGSKQREFWRIEPIPALRPARRFEVATVGRHPIMDGWRRDGWHILDASKVSQNAEAYRIYLQKSRAELSIAKNVYVDTLSGWFSCRSTCYLAASRPVVVQDTGFARFLPTGAGLHAFSDTESALIALDRVESNYRREQRAAREVAGECFDAARVLRDLLQRVGLE